MRFAPMRRHRASDLDGVERSGWRARRPTVPPTTASGCRCGGSRRKQRAALVHRFVFDLAYRDVGERMGISEEAARQNVSAGLRRLRKEVDR